MPPPRPKEAMRALCKFKELIYRLLGPSFAGEEEEDGLTVSLRELKGALLCRAFASSLVLPRMTWIWQRGGSLNSRRAKRPWLRGSSRFHNAAGKGFPRRDRRWRWGGGVGAKTTVQIGRGEEVGESPGRMRQGEKIPSFNGLLLLSSR